jgi:hypothetical protein
MGPLVELHRKLESCAEVLNGDFTMDTPYALSSSLLLRSVFINSCIKPGPVGVSQEYHPRAGNLSIGIHTLK